MNRRFCRASIFLFLASLPFGGCGPIYDTVYDFDPPRSPTGTACIQQCGFGRSQCLELEEMRYQRCESLADADQRYCQYNMRLDGKKEKWYDCTRTSCSKDSDRCDGAYRSCYESCGGRVSSRQVCIMNCIAGPSMAN